MSGPRQTLEVLEGKGRKHLTKAEKYERAGSEVHPPRQKYVVAPKYLPEGLRREFQELSRQLIALGIFTRLDRDTLAMYLMSFRQWRLATEKLDLCLEEADTDKAAEWSSLQTACFRQARSCAGDLGLTVTSRCRLVLPKKEEEKPDELELLLSKKYG